MAKKYSKGAHSLSIPMPSADKVGGMDKYEVEDAARTLTRHQEIKANHKLHKAAMKHLKHKQALIARATKEK